MSNTRHATGGVRVRPLSESRVAALRRLAIGEATEADARRARARATKVVAWGSMQFRYYSDGELHVMIRDALDGTHAWVYASEADLAHEWAEVEHVARRLESQGEAELWTPGQ